MFEDSLCGQYLIAGKQLRDSNFFKTVVLIVEHGAQGTMGLVLNRPSSVTIAHALSEHFNLPETDDLVFVGGPVEPSALFILHNAGHLDEEKTPVSPGLYLGSSAEVFETVVRSACEKDACLEFRIFSGCAGWAPGQLEGELERGDWHLLSASTESLFLEDCYELWDILLRKLGESSQILPESHGNPEWN